MREIIRSVKPYWFYLICEGIKKAEVGKSKPTAQNWNKAVYLYCSKDKKSFNRIPKEHREKYRKYLGTIGARFISDKIDNYRNFIINPINKYEQKTIDGILNISCLSHGELCEYLTEREDNKHFYIWHISNLVIYEKPRELYDFVNYAKHEVCLQKNCFNGDCWSCPKNAIMVRPPQSWCYVKREGTE